MLNLKFLLKKIIGNSDKEMDLFLDCKNGELTESKLRDYIRHFGIDMNTPLVARSVSHRGYEGYTPLMLYLTSLNCKLEIVALMLENGVDVNHQSKYGHTAAHMLAYGTSDNKLEILKLLKGAGADFDLKNSSGIPVAGNFIGTSSTTGEQLDYILNNSYTTKYCLEECPFPFKRDVFSEAIVQSLYGVELNERIEIIKVLIKHKFDINKKSTFQKETPLKLLQKEIEKISSKSNLTDLEQNRLGTLKEIELLLVSNGATS